MPLKPVQLGQNHLIAKPVGPQAKIQPHQKGSIMPGRPHRGPQVMRAMDASYDQFGHDGLGEPMGELPGLSPEELADIQKNNAAPQPAEAYYRREEHVAWYTAQVNRLMDLADAMRQFPETHNIDKKFAGLQQVAHSINWPAPISDSEYQDLRGQAIGQVVDKYRAVTTSMDKLEHSYQAVLQAAKELGLEGADCPVLPTEHYARKLLVAHTILMGFHDTIRDPDISLSEFEVAVEQIGKVYERFQLPENRQQTSEKVSGKDQLTALWERSQLLLKSLDEAFRNGELSGAEAAQLWQPISPSEVNARRMALQIRNMEQARDRIATADSRSEINHAATNANQLAEKLGFNKAVPGQAQKDAVLRLAAGHVQSIKEAPSPAMTVAAYRDYLEAAQGLKDHEHLITRTEVAAILQQKTEQLVKSLEMRIAEAPEDLQLFDLLAATLNHYTKSPVEYKDFHIKFKVDRGLSDQYLQMRALHAAYHTLADLDGKIAQAKDSSAKFHLEVRKLEIKARFSLFD